MKDFQLRSIVTFQRFGAVFFVLYLLLLVLMFLFVWQAPSQTVNLDRLRAQPYDLDQERTMHFPKKPNQDQDTPCFYNIQPFQKPVFREFLPKVHLVSAFYITFKEPEGTRSEIRILTLLEGDTPPTSPVYCLYRHRGVLNYVEGKFLAFQSENDGKYQVYILTCSLSQETSPEEMCKVYVSQQPSFVNIEDTITMPLLPIEEKQYPFSFALCIPPLRGIVPQNRLIEFIELNNILGADHFIFYRYEGDSTGNYSNPNIDEVLNYYEKVGLATVHPWKLPILAEDVWHYGWKLAMHHCLMTNMWTYKYLLFSDVDEFLVPRGDLSHWSDMMYKLDDDKYSGYCFYSSFFPPEPGDLFLTMASLLRAQVINSQHMKCMVRPERVMEMGHQDVIKWALEGVSTMEVNESLALIHHYKSCDKSIQGNCHDMIKDEVLLKFADNLYSNHKSVMRFIMNTRENQQR